jgi:hypothetical protein
MFDSSKANGYSDESNMNSLQKKWQSRRIKHELSTKQMVVKTNQTWTLYKTNGCQDESSMNSLICVVESSCLIRLDSQLCCKEFMFDSSWQPVVLLRVHVLLVLTAISFVESSCLIRLDNHELSTKQMAVNTNQTWTLYNTNGCQDDSNMNSLQNKWQSRRIKHELSTKEMAVKTNQTWTLHLFCREFMFDSSWQPFLL